MEQANLRCISQACRDALPRFILRTRTHLIRLLIRPGRLAHLSLPSSRAAMLARGSWGKPGRLARGWRAELMPTVVNSSQWRARGSTCDPSGNAGARASQPCLSPLPAQPLSPDHWEQLGYFLKMGSKNWHSRCSTATLSLNYNTCHGRDGGLRCISQSNQSSK